VDDQVAAEHGETGVGALVPRVHGAVGVLDDVPGYQLLLVPQLQGLRGGGAGVGRGLSRFPRCAADSVTARAPDAGDAAAVCGLSCALATAMGSTDAMRVAIVTVAVAMARRRP
jgi:hypothetical protein